MKNFTVQTVNNKAGYIEECGNDFNFAVLRYISLKAIGWNVAIVEDGWIVNQKEISEVLHTAMLAYTQK